jgi:CO/xanthine dehydrogenase FAD-binding subunit
MRPAPFALVSPQTLNEVIELADQQDVDTVLLAGGQTLIPLMNMRIVRPDRVIDLSGVSELSGISVTGEDVVVSAMTRQAELRAPSVLQASPLLHYVTRFVGQVQTRSRGTVGGSIALGSSVGELCVTLLALDGRLRVDRPDGPRWIESANFFIDYLTTAIGPGEILTEVRFPTLGDSARWGFSELKLRACDFPIVVAVAILQFDGDACTDARIAMGGVDAIPVRVAAAELELVGGPVAEGDVQRAAARLEEDISPGGDLHASADYRRRVASSQLVRALRMAMSSRSMA